MTTRKPPPIDPTTGRYKKSATLEWRECSWSTCRHLAWRVGENLWECACIRNGCHPGTQRYDPDGNVVNVWEPFRFRDVATS